MDVMMVDYLAERMVEMLAVMSVDKREVWMDEMKVAMLDREMDNNLVAN